MDKEGRRARCMGWLLKETISVLYYNDKKRVEECCHLRFKWLTRTRNTTIIIIIIILPIEDVVLENRKSRKRKRSDTYICREKNDTNHHF
jgi:hypothetical protein